MPDKIQPCINYLWIETCSKLNDFILRNLMILISLIKATKKSVAVYIWRCLAALKNKACHSLDRPFKKQTSPLPYHYSSACVATGFAPLPHSALPLYQATADCKLKEESSELRHDSWWYVSTDCQSWEASVKFSARLAWLCLPSCLSCLPLVHARLGK